MKGIILAGGLGTRLAELTHDIPKPMVTIGNIPVLLHIINIYKKYRHFEFYIAMGYKYEYIINYFNQKNLKIEDIATNDGDLEDVFVQLTKH